MADRQQVEAKLRELIGRLDEAGDMQRSLSDSLEAPKVLAIHLPDLEADYWAEMASGRMDDLHPGAPERADIRIRVSSDDLIDLVDGRASMLSSVLAGRVKIDASLADLMRLRRLS